MQSLLSKIAEKYEQLLWSKKPELCCDCSKNKLIVFLPGLSGFVKGLFSVVNYVRKNKKDYNAFAIPLGGSFSDFDSLIKKVVTKINTCIEKNPNLQEIIVFGHSHGGRVAVASVNKLAKQHPSLSFGVISAGTPLVKMPNNNKFYVWIWKFFSKAMCDWLPVSINKSPNLKYVIGFYSKSDKVVPESFMEDEYSRELNEIVGASHNDLYKPEYIGEKLLSVLNER